MNLNLTIKIILAILSLYYQKDWLDYMCNYRLLDSMRLNYSTIPSLNKLAFCSEMEFNCCSQNETYK